MRLAIIGSRTFANYNFAEMWIDSMLNFTCDRDAGIEVIISGGASGADTLAEKYADKHNIEKEIYLPDWYRFGKQAAFIRNKQIIDNCDMVLAFWDGQSKGTKDSIVRAKLAKKPTFIVYF